MGGLGFVSFAEFLMNLLPNHVLPYWFSFMVIFQCLEESGLLFLVDQHTLCCKGFFVFHGSLVGVNLCATLAR